MSMTCRVIHYKPSRIQNGRYSHGIVSLGGNFCDCSGVVEPNHLSQYNGANPNNKTKNAQRRCNYETSFPTVPKNRSSPRFYLFEIFFEIVVTSVVVALRHCSTLDLNPI